MFFENPPLVSLHWVAVSEASGPSVCMVRSRQEEMWTSKWMGSLRSFLLFSCVAQ